MSDKPTLPGFLSLLSQATDDSSPAIKDIVKNMIEKRSFSDTLQYYEIREEPMLRDLIADVVTAINKKMTCDFEAHTVGSNSLQHLLLQAIAFSLVAGAQLAKDKKI